MRDPKITFKFVLLFKILVLTNLLYAQNTSFPDNSIVKKYAIKQIKVYKYYPINTDTNNLTKRQLISKYEFNSRGQLIKEKQINVLYSYYYNDTLMMIQDKWKIFTNRWIEGIPYSCACYYKDSILKSTIVKEYQGKCKKRNKSKDPIQIFRIYSDSLGRDTLTIIEFNKWYYAHNDTDYTKNKYSYIGKNLIEWKKISCYGSYKNEDLRHIRTNSQNQIIEIYKPGNNNPCSKEMLEYKKDILVKKVRYNCLDEISNVDIYEYKYYKKEKLPITNK